MRTATATASAVPSSTAHTSPDAPATAETQPKPKPAKSISPRKLAANRANAARSTGPRTDAGRARSAMNALRHGLAARAALLPGEDPAELDELARELEADLRPRGAMQRELVGRIVSISWRLRRVGRAEEALWESEDGARNRSFDIGAGLRAEFGYPAMTPEDEIPPAPHDAGQFLAAQFARRESSPLERLALYEQRLDRALHAAMRQLLHLQKAQENQPEPPEAPFDRRSDVRANVGTSFEAQRGTTTTTTSVAATTSPDTFQRPSVVPRNDGGSCGGQMKRTDVQNEPTAPEPGGASTTGVACAERTQPRRCGEGDTRHESADRRAGG